MFEIPTLRHLKLTLQFRSDVIVALLDVSVREEKPPLGAQARLSCSIA